MDYHVFLVRHGGAGSRNVKGGAKLLKVLENSFSLASISGAQTAPVIEYNFEQISNVLPSSEDATELTLDVSESNGKEETLRLWCDSRSALLTALLNKLDDLNGIGTDFLSKKHSHQQGGLIDTVLRVRSVSIVKMVNVGVRQERRKVNPAKKVNFHDILKIRTLLDDQHVVLIYLKSRILRLTLKDSQPFLTSLKHNMQVYLNREIEIGKITTATMIENVSTYLRKLKTSSTLYEFHVTKHLEAKKQLRYRVVSITKEYLIERSGDEIIGAHSLNDILGLIVSDKNTNEVVLELRSWRPTQYMIEDRGDFLASLADAIGMAKGSKFCMHLVPFFRHMVPDQCHASYQAEHESYYLNRFMAAYNSGKDQASVHISLKEFSSNVPFGDSQFNDPKIVQAIAELLREWFAAQDFVRSTTCCIALQRLFSSRTCFDALKTSPEVASALLQCVRSKNAILVYAATSALNTAIKFAIQPGMVDAVIQKQETLNKLTMLSVENLQQLVSSLQTYFLAEENTLQLYSILKLLSSAFITSLEGDAPRAWMKTFESSIIAVVDVICDISRSSSPVICLSIANFLKLLLTKASPILSNHLQKMCLGRCLVLLHLKNAIFSKMDEIKSVSGELVYLMVEGNQESRKLVESVLPMGAMQYYASKVSKALINDVDVSQNRLVAWVDLLETLRRDTFETPVLVWNEKKRIELQKFLQSEVDAFNAASKANRSLMYNYVDSKLFYSPTSEGGASIVRGVHLELLVDDHLHHNSPDFFWKLWDPLPVFQSIFHALVLSFTTLFGHSNLPELDPRLAVHALTWIYERHSTEVSFTFDTLNVIETAVGMFREVFESEHQVFIFKLVVFLLASMEKVGHENVVRFVRAGGTSVLVSFMVLSLAKCCEEPDAFECDAWSPKNSSGAVETVTVVGINGEFRLVRVPSGRSREVLGKAVMDGSLDAKDAIKWQDESVPSKIQLGLALDLVEALLRLSGSESPIETFPPSLACMELCKEEVLCHLVQALLRAKTPAFGRILEIVLYLVKANKVAMRKLYKLGAFEILLWKLLQGDIIESDRVLIANFLFYTHLHQDANPRESEHLALQPLHDSILRLYLPEGMILKFLSEGPDSFCELIDLEQNTPEVIWNIDMKQRLIDHLTNELEPYVKFRSTDPLALYIQVPKEPLIYPELTDILFTAPFYLENLLDSERFPNYPINDPVGFLNHLMLDLKKVVSNLNLSEPLQSAGENAFSQIHILLSAQAELVDRFPQFSLPNDVESTAISLALPALEHAITLKGESPSIVTGILQQATKIMRRICAAQTRSKEVPTESMNFALSVLSLGTHLKEDGSFPESSTNVALESAIAGAVLVLDQISSSKEGRKLLQGDPRWKKGLWWALCSAAGDAASVPPRGPTLISFAALSCLKHFAQDHSFSGYIIQQGLYLPLLLLAIPPANVTVKAQDTKSAVLYTAADVLAGYVQMLGSMHIAYSENLVMPFEKKYLLGLIPAPLLLCLEKTQEPEKFITLAASDILQPMALWTADTREELRRKVYQRLQLHGKVVSGDGSDMDDEVEWLRKFTYECLQGEPTIGGAFVRGLANCDWENIDLPSEEAFLESIQNYLDKNYTTVALASFKELADTEEDGEGGAPDTAASDYLSILKALREWIKHAVQYNKEAVLGKFRPSVLSKIVLHGKAHPKAQIELALIARVLVEDSKFIDIVLQSQLMKALTVQLWEAIAEFQVKGMDEVLYTTVDMFYVLSEKIPATIQATNYFASCGVILPLLALFCKVELSVIRGSGLPNETEAWLRPLYLASRLLAARTIGQLLLAGNGVSRRAKLLKDLAERKSYANGASHEKAALGTGIGEVTDMYELLNAIEHSREDEHEPLVIHTLLLLLPLDLLSTIARNPEEACRVYDGDFLSPRLVWNEDMRVKVRTTLAKEATKVQNLVHNKEICGLPQWSLARPRPIFLRYVLVTISSKEGRPTYRDDEYDDYARELYLGGFFVDQFLRQPEYAFDSILEGRFVQEIRKTLVVGFSTDGLCTDQLTFDDRRRLLLALLLLFRLRPSLLSGNSNIDIFLPLCDLISSLNGQRRALAQPAMLLLHCTATHSDIADYMISEELIHTVASFLTLNIPLSDAGKTSTDPRLCSLMLLLRLLILSSNTTDIVLRERILPKFLDLVLDFGGSSIVRNRAAECLAVMCEDKRRGQEVRVLLEKFVPKSSKGYGAWNIPPGSIQDEVVSMRTIEHFLEHRFPSNWSDNETNGAYEMNYSESVASDEGTPTFAKSGISDFDPES